MAYACQASVRAMSGAMTLSVVLVAVRAMAVSPSQQLCSVPSHLQDARQDLQGMGRSLRSSVAKPEVVRIWLTLTAWGMARPIAESCTSPCSWRNLLDSSTK